MFIGGHSGNVTDALREALGENREELGQRPGSYAEATDRSQCHGSFKQFKTSVEFAWSPEMS